MAIIQGLTYTYTGYKWLGNWDTIIPIQWSPKCIMAIICFGDTIDIIIIWVCLKIQGTPLYLAINLGIIAAREDTRLLLWMINNQNNAMNQLQLGYFGISGSNQIPGLHDIHNPPKGIQPTTWNVTVFKEGPNDT